MIFSYSHHFGIVHGKEGVEVRYVEEDDQEREECAGEADEDDEPELGEVRQCGDTQLGCPRGQQAGQTGHRCHLQVS